jgi:glutamyl-tRNA(Gln) amidotransferase subunit D
MNNYTPPDGYRGALLERLIKEGLRTWSVVRATKGNAVFEGILLPRSTHTDDRILNLKTQDTYYNIGILIDDNVKLEEIGYREGHYKVPDVEAVYKKELPDVTLLGTGGTVASRLDYRTGAVLPAFTPQELFSAVPELMDMVNLSPKILYQILSENFTPEYWVQTAKAVAKEIEGGADGVIIGHGTDTMGISSAYLSFALKNLPVPVVFVGSQRSSDRPSSDGPYNIMNAASLAGYGDLAEVVVCMHGTTSDRYNLIHRGTRVRKMHSSRRDAFRTISDIPLGKIDLNQNITFFKKDVAPRQKGREDFILNAKCDDRVAMLYSHPGMNVDMLHGVLDKGYHGVIIIGTGLAHVGSNMYEPLERAQEMEIPVVMVVQPMFGYAQLRVYETGREMLARGAIEGGNMLPETAFAKLVWTLGHTRDYEKVKKMIQSPYAHEITPSEPNRGYSFFQGIEPGIDNFYDKM